MAVVQPIRRLASAAPLDAVRSPKRSRAASTGCSCASAISTGARSASSPNASSRRRAAPPKRAGRSVRVLINRRADVALAVGADGVHLGWNALPVAAARALLGADAIVGVAAHTPDEVRAAAAQGADYATLAPIFAPLSKPSERAPLGVARARSVRGAAAGAGAGRHRRRPGRAGAARRRGGRSR